MNRSIYFAIVLSSTLWLQSPTVAQQYTRQGAGLGAATGAVIGGVIGHQNDETAEGVVLGGVLGAVTGGVLGNHRDYEQERVRQYQRAAYAQRAYAMSRAASIGDVVTMSRSGVSDQIIVNHIRQNGLQQELAVPDIIALHEQGVSEYVIGAIQQAPSAIVPTMVVERPRVSPHSPTVVIGAPRYAPYPPVARRYCHPRHARPYW